MSSTEETLNVKAGRLTAIEIVKTNYVKHNNKPEKDFQGNENSERAPFGKSRKPCKILRGKNCSAKLTLKQTLLRDKLTDKIKVKIKQFR